MRMLSQAPPSSDPRVVMLESEGASIHVRLARHPRARRIKLSLDERGAWLTLPMRASERAALAFLHTNREWLARHWKALHADAPTALLTGVEAALPLRGEWFPVQWSAGRITRLSHLNGGLHFDVRGLEKVHGEPATPAMRRALREFYEAEARTDIARWMPRHADALPRLPARIVLKRTRSQWGSLSPAGVLALDLPLVLARPSAFEYVLVHELCHLIHHDHSRAFWREVELRCPHWRDERDYLHAEGRRLKARLRVLLGD